MIYHKSKQVGFIEHGEANIDKIMHNGECVFNQGFDSEASGTDSVTLNGTIGKDLMDWSIVGNTYQASIPSPSSPVSVLGVGDRTGNLFDASTQKYVSKSEYGLTWQVNSDNTITVSGEASGYTSFFLANKYSIPSEYRGQKVTFNFNIFGNAKNILWSEIAFYDADDKNVGAYAQGTSSAFTIEIQDNFKKFTAVIKRNNNVATSGTIGLMLNEGSTPLSFEPFGYKIPFVSKSENEITIIGIQPTTNYAYFNRSAMPNVKVGDSVMVYINNNSYKLNIMQIDDNYIYIENKVV